MGDLAAFIDEVYEAAVVPELWPKVLDSPTVIGDGFGWQFRNDRAARLFATRYAGFLTDLDVFTLEEMDREPIFTEFLHSLSPDHKLVPTSRASARLAATLVGLQPEPYVKSLSPGCMHLRGNSNDLGG
jgi:hypothetical protein